MFSALSTLESVLFHPVEAKLEVRPISHPDNTATALLPAYILPSKNHERTEGHLGAGSF